MTELLIGLGVWAFVMLGITLPICADSARRERDRAKRRHPSQWSPDTEYAIEQAVAIVDDGKALVRETEDWLRNGARP